MNVTRFPRIATLLLIGLAYLFAGQSANAQGATQLLPGEVCFQATAGINGMVGTIGTITAGSGGTSGTYPNVALTGGSGSGGTANITVSGGIVTAVTIVNPGIQFVVGDTLSALSANIGGVTGFSFPVASVSINSSLAGGTVGMYIPSTLTTKQTWQDPGQLTLNTNPVSLDQNGCAVMYGLGIYRQVLHDNLGNTVWDKLTTDTSLPAPYWAGTAGGTGNAITVTDTGFSGINGQAISIIASANNTGATTLNPSSFGAIAIVKDTASGPVALTGGEIISGNVYTLTYAQATNQFHLGGPGAQSGSNSVCSLTNVRQAKTSGYTVQSSDIGTTLALGGSAYYTLILSSPGSYSPSCFQIAVVNEDSVRAKLISIPSGLGPSGITSFYLYPGQTCTFVVQSSAWQSECPYRWAHGGTQLFVDAVNGNDNNDGLALGTGGAFATINKSLAVLYNNIDNQNNIPTISVAAGSYGESDSIQGQLTGINVFFLIGAGSSSIWKPANCTSTPYNLLVSDNAEVEIGGFLFDNTGGTNGCDAVATHQTAVIDLLNNITFGTYGSLGTHMSCDHGGSINISNSYTIQGTVGTHIQGGQSCTFTESGSITVTLSGSPTITTFTNLSTGFMSLGPTITFSGSTSNITNACSVTANGVLAKSGNTIPGTASCTSGANGGQVF